MFAAGFIMAILSVVVGVAIEVYLDEKYKNKNND